MKGREEKKRIVKLKRKSSLPFFLFPYMSMKNANLDSVYVVRELKKTVLLLINVDIENLKNPLSEWWIKQLDELSEICDIVFLFPENSRSIIRCDKFTNLCSGHAWIVGNWRKTIPEIFEYSYEILQSHLYHIVLSLENITGLNKDGILKLMMMGLKGPILNIRRKSSSELYNYYRETSKGKEIWRKFPIFWKKENLDKLNFNSLWTTNSKYIWINRGFIPQLLDYAKDGMIDTYETLEDFLGSGIKELNPSTFLCRDIEFVWNDDTKGKE